MPSKSTDWNWNINLHTSLRAGKDFTFDSLFKDTATYINPNSILLSIYKGINMCLALPGKIIKIEGEIATVDYGSLKREANITLVNVKVGDYVLVHVGFAIEKVDEKRAKETYSLLDNVKL